MRSSCIRIFFLLTCWLGLATTGFAQADSLPDDFANPYEVIYNHLNYLQEDNYLPAQSAKSLYRGSRTQKEINNLAIELKQILDGSGNLVRMEDLPKAANYYDSLLKRNRYVITDDFPELYVQKYGDRWLFSEYSVDQIDRLHKQVYPFGTDKLLNILPNLGTTKYLGLHLWQYLGILILLTIGFLVHLIFTVVLRKILFGLLHKYGKIDLANQFLNPVVKPFSLMIIAYLAKILVPVLQLPPFAATNIILLVHALVPLFAAMFFYRLVDILGHYLKRMAERSENTLDDQLVPLVTKVLKVFVVIVGFVAVLRGFKFDIWPILTGLSIGGLAFALAAQDTLKNFFGSLMIFIDRPFQIGDWVTSGDIDGTVEEVGFRSTRVRTFRDSVMYVPNSIISNSMVDNHGKRQYRRFYTRLSITYDTPARLIEVFVKGVEEIVKQHPHTRKDYYNIFLNEYAGSALEVMVYIFFKVPDWNSELRCRQEIMLEVNKLAEHLGVRFAFPTQTLMIEQVPGQKSLTPEYKQSKEEMEAELQAFFNKK
ncbi:mechanosensitive ion channel family protein [Roseivirga thermotolerans]|jgi:MscS family membrane protein|uniref:mechanosensitive ion channel family protein n=1 Tax=Roseivirga thermotolerans TaxID=1758176 RepID=UPI001679CB54|nr:mechanosensitive ion channel family protein [Roseivirga thermotolerans]MEC7756062.1 mechanosensitive ion channel family protein [Bacteroidota bacterium]|tara:strand:+ start:4113 stop:5729 length:1617 start_codon:yes stop_codon:yes gene_type:complete